MEYIDLRDIESVMAVYEARSFSRAAEKCYISQPALSKTVRKVEKNLGIALFDRSTSPLKVTPAGEVIIGYLCELQNIHGKMERYCDALRMTDRSDLTIAAPSFFCTYTLPPIISDYRKEHPDYNIKLVETNDNDLKEFLNAGIADIGISVNDLFLPGLEGSVLKEEQIVLAVPRDLAVNRGLESCALTYEDMTDPHGGFRKKAGVSVRRFEKEPFLMLRQGNDMRRRAMKICQDAGVFPNIVMELDQLLTAYYIASAGQGIAFVRSCIPYYTGRSDKLCFYKIDHPETVRPVFIYSAKSTMLSEKQRDFVEYLKAYPLPW